MTTGFEIFPTPALQRMLEVLSRVDDVPEPVSETIRFLRGEAAAIREELARRRQEQR